MARKSALVLIVWMLAADSASWARGRTPDARPETAARSIGSPTDGRLEGGVELEASRELRLKNPSGARWGLPALVGMLERSSNRLAQRFKGSIVIVGDLSRKQGGEIARHKSHESGRDADVAFFFTHANGEPVPTAEFHVVDADGIAVDDRSLHFDDVRNWALIEAWITDPRTRVEHIFVAEALRTRLLKTAREKGTYLPVRNRAAVALKQPTSGLSHDDHFHVRIACPRRSCVVDPPPVQRATRFASYVRSPHRSGTPLRALVKPRKERETTRR